MNRPDASLDALDAQRLQLIANTVPGLLAYVDERVRYVWVNEAYRRWFGRAPDSHPRPARARDRGRGRMVVLEPHVTRAIAGEDVCFEAHLGFGPGHARDLSVTFFPDPGASGQVRGFVSFATDVSEMRCAERALRESERMLADSQTAAHVGSWEATMTPRGPAAPCVWSDETYRIFGYEPGAVAIHYALFLSAVHPDDRGLLLERRATSGADPTTVSRSEFRIVRPDGAVRTIQSWTTAERDGAGRATRLRGTCQDITARKRAEAEGRRAREHLQVVVDATPALIARYDATSVWSGPTRTTRPASRKRPEDLVGMHLRDIVGEQAFAPARTGDGAGAGGRRHRPRARDPLSDPGSAHDALRRLAHLSTPAGPWTAASR